MTTSNRNASCMKFKPLILSTCVALAGATAPALALAQTAPESASAAPTDSPGAADMSEGEVRKIDKGNQKITLRHGEIRNLEMPGMTMVFRVREPAMLDAVKVGDKVRFSAERVDGAFVVTGIHPLR